MSENNGNGYRHLRTTISNSLSELLGSYTYNKGVSRPAIRVDLGSVVESAQPTVKGLEVIIVPSFEVILAPLLDGYEETYTTRVFLKQWNVEQSILPAIDRIVSVLPNIRQITRTMRMTELDNIETCIFTLVDRAFTRVM